MEIGDVWINLSHKIIKRRNQYVVYLKKAQEIADFIAGIGATNCYLEFEDYRMTRDYYAVCSLNLVPLP